MLIGVFGPALMMFFGAAETFTGKVAEVIKGDVLTVMHADKAETVRLAGVDCPEPAQPFGPEARKFTSDRVLGKDVTFETDGSDLEGRTLVTATLPDGTVLNREVVAAGLGWYCDKHAGADPALPGLMVNAIAVKKGLWADAAPLAPWDFRGDARKTKALESPAVPAAALETTDADAGGAVFITKDGTEYHRLGCVRLDKTQKGITLKEAASMGYKPCRACFPIKPQESAPVLAKKGDLGEVEREFFLKKYQDNPIVKQLGVSMYRDSGGRVAGITAQHISAFPLAGALGFQDEDVVTTVNGDPIDSEARIPDLIEKYKNTRSFSVGILRNGKPQTITINVPDFIK
jgi:endonuclease YncB( thermonuclease family)